jgi:hypothetical protein
MMRTYKLLTDPRGNSLLGFDENGKVYGIPFDPANTDYIAYLKWLEEGNLPSPADIVEPSQASVTPLPADEV